MFTECVGVFQDAMTGITGMIHDDVGHVACNRWNPCDFAFLDFIGDAGNVIPWCSCAEDPTAAPASTNQSQVPGHTVCV